MLPGRRDYLWKVDTLNTSFNFLQSLWGSSATDVWAVGSAGLWHYDGKHWSHMKEIPDGSLNVVFGAAGNNVWIGTDYGRIYHFDGSRWSIFGDYKRSGVSRMLIEDIWGDSFSNVYAVGWEEYPDGSTKAFILKFDGIRWAFLDIPPLKRCFYNIRGNPLGNGKYYLYGATYSIDLTEDPITIIHEADNVFEFDGKRDVREIYSSQTESRYVSEVAGRAVFSSWPPQGVARQYTGGGFSIWKDLSASGYSLGAMCGRSEWDFFSLSTSPLVPYTVILTHCNGTDLKPVFQSENLFGVTVFPNDVFVIAFGNVMAIARGTLPPR